MFNSTHTLVGLAVARTGLDRWTPHAAVTAAIAANLPDIEILTGFAGTPDYLHYHRGITHTFVGVPFLALALALVMYLFTGRFWRTFVVALLAMATHPLLDYANTYGLRPFLPFSEMWFYGDTLFIIDPYLDFILLAGILLGQRFRNVRAAATWISILLAIAYTGARVELRNDARAQLAVFTSRIPDFQKSAVAPQMMNPLVWNGFIETRDEVFKVTIDAFKGVGSELARMRKDAPSKITDQAAGTRSAAVLLGFARFPVTRIEETGTGYRVTFLDFRFYSETTHTALAAEVLLDRSLHAVEESLAFTQAVN